MSSLAWIIRTFSNREDVDDLFRPHVESGELSHHDLELAKDFLPRLRSFPYQTLVLATTIPITVCCYGRLVRVPPWSKRKTLFLTASSSLAGFVYGEYRGFSEHKRFIESLDSVEAYIHALNEVKTKLGGPPGTFSLNKNLQGQLGQRSRNFPSDSESTSSDDFGVTGQVQERLLNSKTKGPDDNSTKFDGEEPSGRRVRDRWSEIRSRQSADNAHNASSSTWEAIREGDMTTRGAQKRTSNDSSTVVSGSSDALASEKAKFEAMLDSERRKASGSS